MLTKAQGAANADGTDNAGNAVSSGSDSDARQKVLDQRTEENNYRYGVAAEHDCYTKFFVNDCLNSARDSARRCRPTSRQEQLALDDERRAAYPHA